MSRFYASIQGSKGEATRMGSAASGIVAHPRGWELGVRVEGHARGDEDLFAIDVTAGSNGGARAALADVHVQSDGLRIVNLDERFGGGTFVIDTNGNVTRIEKS